ncbi:MAG: hypothetical protein ABI907_02355 [Ramlibacter sp.]
MRRAIETEIVGRRPRECPIKPLGIAQGGQEGAAKAWQSGFVPGGVPARSP